MKKKSKSHFWRRGKEDKQYIFKYENGWRCIEKKDEGSKFCKHHGLVTK